MFYEIIYETGNHSIAMYKDDDEAIGALTEHHRRAKAGENAQESHPEMGSAERIVKVLKYDKHPADYNEAQVLNVDELMGLVESVVKEKAVGDLISVPELASAVRDMSSPIVESKPHESNYKMGEKGKLDASQWDAGAV